MSLANTASFTHSVPVRDRLLFMGRPWLSLPVGFRLSVYYAIESVTREAYPPLTDRVHKLLPGLILKWMVREDEAQAISLINQHTSVPAPLLLDFIEKDGVGVILMTEMPGVPLSTIFLSFTEKQFQGLSEELAACIRQIRTIENPFPDAVCSAGNGPIYVPLIWDRPLRVFKTVPAFHDFLWNRCPPRQQACLAIKFEPVLRKEYSSIFCHGDIRPWNILIQDGKLAGLIDWECAGWMPEYWDAMVPLYSSAPIPVWTALIDHISPGYQEARDGIIPLISTIWGGGSEE